MGLCRWLVYSSLIYAVHCVYEIPNNVRLEVFEPKGIRISVPDARNMTFFHIKAEVHGYNLEPEKDPEHSVKYISGSAIKPVNGRWVFENDEIKVLPAYWINYDITVTVNNVNHSRRFESSMMFTAFTIKPHPSTLEQSPSPRRPIRVCESTQTTVKGKPVECGYSVIFEEQFRELSENTWVISHKIPVDHPEFPFNSYQRRLEDYATVSTKYGLLMITPYLQENIPGFTEDSIYLGSLDLLSGCTGPLGTCELQAAGANILPPVVSAKISTRDFSFKYGVVEVRAKLPKGDWIYPEILLEPKLKKYGGLRYESGVLKIACARGNKQLFSGQQSFGNELLYGGPLISQKCNEALLSSRQLQRGQWGDGFHIYSVRWTPELITLTVDGEEWGRIEPGAGGLGGQLPQSCDDAPRDLWRNGTRMAPFDQEFYISLGVAVGGITEFRDGVKTTGGKPKPWVNDYSKAKLRFWEDQASWSETWIDDAQLVVDYVRVTAL